MKRILIGAVPVLLTMSLCCSEQQSHEEPLHVAEWRGYGNGFLEWGTTADGLFGVSSREGGSRVLERWNWEGDALVRRATEELPKCQAVNVLGEGRCLLALYPGSAYAPWPLVLYDTQTGKVVSELSRLDLGVAVIGVSSSRRYAAAIYTPPERLRVYRTDLAESKTQEVLDCPGRPNQMPTGHAAVSNDGRHIAWAKYEMVCMGAESHEIRWITRPPDCIGVTYVRFADDGRIVYGAGDGFVFAFDAATGQILRRWCVSPTGESVYGYRISCMALSPDERRIAVGTGPAGDVYVFDLQGDGRPRLLPHGLITTLAVSWSPDSRYLASMGGGRLKIWEIDKGPDTKPAEKPN